MAMARCTAALANALAGLGLCALATGATAATYDVSWHVVAGGGETFATGGIYTLGATAGQAAADTLVGGVASLRSGFWPALGSGAAPALAAVASRKVHGGAGTFDLALTLLAPVAIPSVVPPARK